MKGNRSGSGAEYTMDVVQDSQIEPTQIKRNQRKPLLDQQQYNLGSTVYQDSGSGAFSTIYAEEPFRWIVLVIFSLGTAAIGSLWNTIIPIASILQEQEGLSWTYINMYTIVFYAAFLPSNFVSNYIIEEKGLRTAVMLGFLFCMVGSWMRVTFNYSLVIALVGQAIAALANPVFLNAPSKIASVWFKPNSRNLATNIAAASNIFGNAIGALIPPWIVKSGDRYHKSQITLLMIVEAAFVTVVFILGLFFYRNKPKTPPSPAALADRHSTCESLKILVTSGNFLILTFTFFCANGSVNGITGVIQEIFSHYQYEHPESYSSLVSTLMFLLGFIGSLGFGLLADKTKKLKLLLFLTNFLAAASLAFLTWFIQLKNKLISGIICCAFGTFNISIIGLSLELASEITYPVGESNSSGLLMMSSQVAGIALTYITSALFDAASPHDTHSAYITNLMNFILASVGALVVLLVKEDLKRTKHEAEVRNPSNSKISVHASSISQ